MMLEENRPSTRKLELFWTGDPRPNICGVEVMLLLTRLAAILELIMTSECRFKSKVLSVFIGRDGVLRSSPPRRSNKFYPNKILQTSALILTQNRCLTRNVIKDITWLLEELFVSMMPLFCEICKLSPLLIMSVPPKRSSSAFCNKKQHFWIGNEKRKLLMEFHLCTVHFFMLC